MELGDLGVENWESCIEEANLPWKTPFGVFKTILGCPLDLFGACPFGCGLTFGRDMGYMNPRWHGTRVDECDTNLAFKLLFFFLERNLMDSKKIIAEFGFLLIF